MIILGLTGPIGHGKTTLANFLTDIEPASVHLESFLVIAEIANKLQAKLTEVPEINDFAAINKWLRNLPEIVEKVTHTSCNFTRIELKTADVNTHPEDYEKLFLYLEKVTKNPKLINQKITFKNKEDYRPLLQWLGGYIIKKVEKGIWFKEILRRVDVSATQGKKLAIVVGLRYPIEGEMIQKAGGKVIKIERPGMAASDLTDLTERERDKIAYDCLVENNGSLDQLRICAQQLLKDAVNNNLRPKYKAI